MKRAIIALALIALAAVPAHAGGRFRYRQKVVVVQPAAIVAAPPAAIFAAPAPIILQQPQALQFQFAYPQAQFVAPVVQGSSCFFAR